MTTWVLYRVSGSVTEELGRVIGEESAAAARLADAVTSWLETTDSSLLDRSAPCTLLRDGRDYVVRQGTSSHRFWLAEDLGTFIPGPRVG